MTASLYKEYVLPESVDHFISENVKWYSYLFQKILLEKDISTARKVTFMPVGLDVKSIEGAYEGGGVANYKITRNWIVGKIHEFLERVEDSILLFHSAGKPQDSWIKNSKLPFVFFGDSTFIALSCQDEPDLGNIIEALDITERLYHVAIGALTYLPNPKMASGTELSKEQMTLLAQNAQHLLLSAFDCEGYIICSFDQKRGKL